MNIFLRDPSFQDRRDITGLFDTYARKQHAPDFDERDSYFTNRLVRRALRQERWGRTRRFFWYLMRGLARKAYAPLHRWAAPRWVRVQAWAQKIVGWEIAREPLLDPVARPCNWPHCDWGGDCPARDMFKDCVAKRAAGTH